jgi:hypothetical protein
LGDSKVLQPNITSRMSSFITVSKKEAKKRWETVVGRRTKA